MGMEWTCPWDERAGLPSQSAHRFQSLDQSVNAAKTENRTFSPDAGPIWRRFRHLACQNDARAGR